MLSGILCTADAVCAVSPVEEAIGELQADGEWLALRFMSEDKPEIPPLPS